MATYTKPMKPLKLVNNFERRRSKEKQEALPTGGKPTIEKRSQHVRIIRAFATTYDQKLTGSPSRDETLLQQPNSKQALS